LSRQHCRRLKISADTFNFAPLCNSISAAPNNTRTHGADAEKESTYASSVEPCGNYYYYNLCRHVSAKLRRHKKAINKTPSAFPEEAFITLSVVLVWACMHRGESEC